MKSKPRHKMAAKTVWHFEGLLFTSLNPTSTHQAEWVTMCMASGLLIPIVKLSQEWRQGDIFL